MLDIQEIVMHVIKSVKIIIHPPPPQLDCTLFIGCYHADDTPVIKPILPFFNVHVMDELSQSNTIYLESI